MRFHRLFMLAAILCASAVTYFSLPGPHNIQGQWGMSRVEGKNCPLYYPRESPWWEEIENQHYHLDE